jgi:hypothetical protein
MNTYLRIVLSWICCVILSLADRILFGEEEGITLGDGIVYATSGLLGVVTFFLCKSELCVATKCIFVNLCIFFLGNSILQPVFDLVRHSFSWSDPWYRIWFYQYYILLYMSLLFGSILFLATDRMTDVRETKHKYLFVALLTLAVSAIIAQPYLLSKQIDYVDCLAIRRSVDTLSSKGDVQPTPAAIAAYLTGQEELGQISLVKCEDGDRERRIAELLPYVPGVNSVQLLFSPLWRTSAMVALACVILLSLILVHQYVVDKYVSAYVEKIVWCLLVYCMCESLHMYLYTRVSDDSVEKYVALFGQVLSGLVMLAISLLCLLRMHFIQSVEGKYYERKLLADAAGITRWRDSFDNWILHQFMDREELDRRFLTHRGEEKDDENESE